MGDTAAIVVAVAVAAVLGALGPLGLRLLPEPAEPESDKPTYRALAQSRNLAAILAAVAASVVGLIAARVGAEPILIAWIYVAVIGVLLSYIDARTRLLPYLIVAPSYLIVLALIVLAVAWDQSWSTLGRVALANVAVFAFFFVSRLFFRSSVGAGDVRLSGMLGALLGWHGWAAVGAGLYAAFVLGAVIGLALSLAKIVDRKAIPFGPFLFLGTLVGVLLFP